MILGTSSIREVIAFPKNRSAFCPLTQAPSPVAVEQLAELGLLELGGPQPYPGSKEQQDLIDSLSWVSRIRIDAKERPAIAAAIDDAKAYADLINSRCGEDEPMFSVIPVANRTRHRLVRATVDLFGHVDLLVFPTRRLEQDAARAVTIHHIYDAFSLTLPANVTGQPSLHVPSIALHPGADIGVQLTGLRLEDTRLLSIGMKLSSTAQGGGGT